MNNKGFTLIELLVVIAVIALLSSVILASLGTARTKAADSAVKAQLNQLRSASEIAFDETSSYLDVCSGTTTTRLFQSGARSGTMTTGQSLCVSMQGTTIKSCYPDSASPTLFSCGQSATSNSEPSGDKWVAAVQMRGGNWYCVDYRGAAQIQNTRTVDTSPTTVHCAP